MPAPRAVIAAFTRIFTLSPQQNQTLATVAKLSRTL